MDHGKLKFNYFLNAYGKLKFIFSMLGECICMPGLEYKVL